MTLEAVGGGAIAWGPPEKPNYLYLFQDRVYEEGC